MKPHGIMGGGEICLNCPYPRCVLDRQKRYTKGKKKRVERNAQIKEMKEQGKSVSEIAVSFNLSKRSIHWILQQECKKEVA